MSISNVFENQPENAIPNKGFSKEFPTTPSVVLPTNQGKFGPSKISILTNLKSKKWGYLPLIGAISGIALSCAGVYKLLQSRNAPPPPPVNTPSPSPIEKDFFPYMKFQLADGLLDHNSCYIENYYNIINSPFNAKKVDPVNKPNPPSNPGRLKLENNNNDNPLNLFQDSNPQNPKIASSFIIPKTLGPFVFIGACLLGVKKLISSYNPNKQMKEVHSILRSNKTNVPNLRNEIFKQTTKNKKQKLIILKQSKINSLIDNDNYNSNEKIKILRKLLKNGNERLILYIFSKLFNFELVQKLGSFNKNKDSILDELKHLFNNKKLIKIIFNNYNSKNFNNPGYKKLINYAIKNGGSIHFLNEIKEFLSKDYGKYFSDQESIDNTNQDFLFEPFFLSILEKIAINKDIKSSFINKQQTFINNYFIKFKTFNAFYQIFKFYANNASEFIPNLALDFLKNLKSQNNLDKNLENNIFKCIFYYYFLNKKKDIALNFYASIQDQDLKNTAKNCLDIQIKSYKNRVVDGFNKSKTLDDFYKKFTFYIEFKSESITKMALNSLKTIEHKYGQKQIVEWTLRYFMRHNINYKALNFYDLIDNTDLKTIAKNYIENHIKFYKKNNGYLNNWEQAIAKYATLNENDPLIVSIKNTIENQVPKKQLKQNDQNESNKSIALRSSCMLNEIHAFWLKKRKNWP